MPGCGGAAARPTYHGAMPPVADPTALVAAVRAALAAVQDPEIHRPITELGMVRSVDVGPDGSGGTLATVGLDLTTPGCPLKDTLTRDITAAASGVPGITAVRVAMGVMSAEQRTELRSMLRGGSPEPVIPFAQPTSLTTVLAIASGKGGVGKSSVTANLAAAMAADGLRVGVLDADVYGFSIPRMLGVSRPPTRVDDMLLPPIAHGVKVVSIGMFVPAGQPVVWRGPMLHRALQQFLADVFWGDLDVLLLDLPPGTGDIAISVAQLLPSSEIVVVTTPQVAAAEVAERAGAVAQQTRQRVVGVVENMSWLEQPDGSRLEVFGAGGGATVAANLSRTTGTQVPLLGQVPLDVSLREAGDSGLPVVLAAPESPAAVVLRDVARRLASRGRGLAGRPLGLAPVAR
ncbi:iron-sulfur cluster carrier protein [Cellulomonas aerilata]|uniref:Iron-sulfur cluster carrier protein n=2 Tax=Cellulomonas aerilata TaxID=515326 RepID=A0A512D9E4_9CELL|nr:iron-sulfur cluster carrier protein [Cellulomonas aerilata]